MIAHLNYKPTILALMALFSGAFFIRAIVFYYSIAPNNYYHQPDSYDYHVGAICIASGNGMFRPDIKQPIFWRTPGYSYFLHFFYKAFGINDARFEGNTSAQKAALWVQIILNSFLPLIIFALAYLLTQSYCIAWITSIISIVHTGFILASMYVLSEGPSILFFYLFLIAFFNLILKNKTSWRYLLLAVSTLSLYTWMRPMGLWIGIISMLLITLFSALPFKKRLLIAGVFGILFGGSLAPWYIRNYRYTHEYFFNPTLGPYLNCFSVPKILRRVYNLPLEQACKVAQHNAAYEVRKRQNAIGSQGLFVSQEACKKYAYPVIAAHPGYFIYDWITECIKTTFDLYNYQLVALANNTYSWDPLEEYLPEKWALTLYKGTLPIAIRTLGWIELIFMLMLWIGLLKGIGQHILYPLYKRQKLSPQMRIWITAALLSGATIGMTGGFGYARLRLPIEPLLIILSLAIVMPWIFGILRKQRSLDLKK